MGADPRRRINVTRRELLLRTADLAPAALLPSFLVACGNDSQGGGEGGNALDILVGFGTGNAPDQMPTQEEPAAAFESSGGRPISFRRIPDGDEAQRQLGVLIAAGTPPDIRRTNCSPRTNSPPDRGLRWEPCA